MLLPVLVLLFLLADSILFLVREVLVLSYNFCRASIYLVRKSNLYNCVPSLTQLLSKLEYPLGINAHCLTLSYTFLCLGHPKRLVIQTYIACVPHRMDNLTVICDKLFFGCIAFRVFIILIAILIPIQSVYE